MYYLLLLLAPIIWNTNHLSFNNSDSITGTYSGFFSYNEFEVDLEFEIKHSEGVFEVFFTSVGQNAYKIPTRNVVVDGNSISFTLQSDYYIYSFTNKVNAEGNVMDGTLRVDGRSFSYQLSKINSELSSVTKEELVFTSSGLTLKGSIWEPKESNGLGLVLVTSSGLSDRNSSNAEAYFFSQKGFTVFHYDKRSTGQSEGSLHEITIEELAEDDIAGIKALVEKKGITLDKIGIMGSSQGGTKIPYIMSQIPELKFGVAVSTPGSSLLESDLNYYINTIRDRLKEDDIPRLRNMQRNIYTYLASKDKSQISIEDDIEEHQGEDWFNLVWVPNNLNQYMPWLTYSPIPYFKEVKQSILVIQGMNDIVIPPNSYEVIESVLKGAGNSSYKVIRYPAADHSMMVGSTEDFPYWSRLEPNYFSDIQNWIESLE